MGQSYQALSVDHSIEADADGSTVTLLDIVGNVDEDYEKVNKRLSFRKGFTCFADIERRIIQYTYLEDMSQKEAGEILGISQMHVSRLQRQAIKKLQDAIRM